MSKFESWKEIRLHYESASLQFSQRERIKKKEELKRLSEGRIKDGKMVKR